MSRVQRRGEMRTKLPWGDGQYDMNIEAFVDWYIKTNGLSPTVREVMAAAHTKSTSVVTYTLQRMAEARGDTFNRRIARGYVRKEK